MNLIDHYIQSFLTGTISTEDHAALRKWIKQDIRYKKYFHDAVVIWKATAIDSNEAGFDVNKAITLFEKESKAPVNLYFYKLALRISSVAVVFLVCTITTLFFLKQTEQTVTDDYKEYIVEVPAGAKSKITFPDGSTVWLNAGSKVTYNSNFAKESRNIELSGEGYFEVTKNEKLPFVVNTEKLAVQVLGTKFNLKSYTEDEVVKVVLKEGAIKVGDFRTKVNPVLLKPNQQLTLQKSGNLVSIDSIDASHIENWRNGTMVFDEVSLEEIAKELKRLYNIPIQIENDKLKDIVYYSDFQENTTVEKTLEILSSGNKFRYEVKPELIRIYN